jgi:uncharacterized protein with FMN-binding domain
MKKILVSIALVLVIAGYVFYRSLTVSAPNETPSSATTQPVAQTPVATSSAPVTTQGRYKNGTYIGDAVDAFFGIVQVQAVITNGRIDKITFLKYPNDRENTIRISNESMPVLIQEAIKKQSAKVDIISGATQTTEGFQQSLASALAKAES